MTVGDMLNANAESWNEQTITLEFYVLSRQKMRWWRTVALFLLASNVITFGVVLL